MERQSSHVAQLRTRGGWTDFFEDIDAKKPWDERQRAMRKKTDTVMTYIFLSILTTVVVISAYYVIITSNKSLRRSVGRFSMTLRRFFHVVRGTNGIELEGEDYFSYVPA